MQFGINSTSEWWLLIAWGEAGAIMPIMSETRRLLWLDCMFLLQREASLKQLLFQVAHIVVYSKQNHCCTEYHHNTQQCLLHRSHSNITINFWCEHTALICSIEPRCMDEWNSKWHKVRGTYNHAAKLMDTWVQKHHTIIGSMSITLLHPPAVKIWLPMIQLCSSLSRMDSRYA